MNLQIINDQNGYPSGVFIPMSEWEELKNKYFINETTIITKFDNIIDNNILFNSLKQSIYEVSLIEKGKLEKKSAFQLLDEL